MYIYSFIHIWNLDILEGDDGLLLLLAHLDRAPLEPLYMLHRLEGFRAVEGFSTRSVQRCVLGAARKEATARAALHAPPPGLF